MDLPIDLLNNIAISGSHIAQEINRNVLVEVLAIEGALCFVVRNSTLSKQLSELPPLLVLLKNLVEERLMQLVQVAVSEDSSQKHVVAEVRPLLKVGVHVRQRVLEGPQYHVSVLLSEDDVANTASSEYCLFSDGLDFPYDVAGL